jgi:flagellar biosynthesis/type III secretory pathway protein FliH
MRLSLVYKMDVDKERKEEKQEKRKEGREEGRKKKTLLFGVFFSFN